MPTPDFTRYDSYIDSQFDSWVEELRAFCAEPTLAALGIGFERGVELLRGLLEPLGASITEVPVEGAPPVVLAEIGSGERTLLLYNHYDVQPPEPLELWESPPYAGEIRNGRMYARGVADDRGDLLSRVLAIRAYREAFGELPMRIRWFIEGEEEVGSPHIAPVIEAHADKLQANWCAWEGSGRGEDGAPRVVCGVKGILYVELHATGPNRDAHSGLGGVLPNPAWRLVMALSTLRDTGGRFTMDGLEDVLEPVSELDRAATETMPFDNEARMRLYGIEEKGWQRGLTGRDVIFEEMFAPTANIAGFVSGFTGTGAKTIVPAEATVKVDFRLVPGQTPERMMEMLRAHLDRRGYTDVEITQLGGLHPAKTPIDHPLVEASVEAWRDLGEEGVAVAPMTGGSGPMSFFTAKLGIPTVVTAGVADADNRVHSPNESIALSGFKDGIRYWGRFFARLAESG
jgi:acetylornithine deacetylase/succinyl-diaminopimelate desuccinylase-like protein